MIVPPVALQRTPILAVSPVEVRPITTNCAIWPVRRDEALGEISTMTTLDGSVANGISQAIIATAQMMNAVFIRASRCASLCRNVISSLPCPLVQFVNATGPPVSTPGIAGGPADLASALAVVP